MLAESSQDWAVTDYWIMEWTVDKLLYRGNYHCWIGSSTSCCRHTVQQLRYAADSLKEQCNIWGLFLFFCFFYNELDRLIPLSCLSFKVSMVGYRLQQCDMFPVRTDSKGGACHRYWLASLVTNSADYALSPLTWSYWFANYPPAASFSRN